MLSSAFREFESDPFFDFGNSPFRRARDPDAQRRHRSDYRPRAIDDAHGDDAADPRYQGALVPAPRRPAAAEAHESDADQATRQIRSSRRAPAEQPGAAVEAEDRRRQLEPRGAERRVAQRRVGGREDDFALAPFPSLLGGFGTFEQHFNQMLGGMQRMMADMGDRMRQMEEAASREDFDGHMYSHASVYSRRYDGEGGGEPHVYQAMSETRAGPGGVRETRRAVRDTRAQEERAAHGRHIGARGHVVERRRHMGTGDGQEDHKYTGIGEDEVDNFDREWHSRATALAAVDDDARRRQRAVGGAAASRRHESWRRPAIGSSDADGERRRGGSKL